MDQSFGPAHSLLGRVLAEQGQYDEALTHLAQGGLPRQTYLVFAAQVEGAAGRTALGEQHLNEALALSEDVYLSPFYVALALNGLGKPEEAITWLERAYDEQDFVLVNVYADPRLAELRTSPRLARLISRMGFPGKL